jgi:hypothetical protein
MTDTAPGEAFDAALDALPAAIGATARALRAEALGLLPGALETFDGRYLGIGTGTRISETVFVVSAFRDHVTLGLPNGAMLPDPGGLLEGAGKRHRHLKLRTPDDISRPALQVLLRRAVEARRTG